MPNSPFKKAVAAAKGSAPDGAMTLDLDEGLIPHKSRTTSIPTRRPQKDGEVVSKDLREPGFKDDQDRTGKILELRG